MSARRTPVDRMILGQEQGPDSIMMAGWGLIAVFAFLFAFGAWKFNSETVGRIVTARIEPTPMNSIDTVVTGSTANRAPAGTTRALLEDGDPAFKVPIWQPEERVTDNFDQENDELLSEIVKLRRALENVREHNRDLSQRLAVLEDTGVDPMTTASVRRRQPVAEARPIESVEPARPIPMPAEIVETPEAASIVIGSTQFAIDIGGYDTLATAREGWRRLKNVSPDIIVDLRPRTRAVTRKDGEPEIRLLGGPYANVAEAAKACAALSTLDVACRPGEFAGEELTGL